MSTISRVCLVVLDGFGERADQKGNAVRLAKTPTFDRLYKTCPWTLIGASENDVGLPKGQMGNSEVGHLNLGAGRIVYQDIVRIDKAIDDGKFYENPTLVKLVDAVKASGGTLHLFGLTSPGNVHAALEHAYAVCELAKRRGLKKVAWHAFLDGRDTPPKSAAGYLRQVGAKLKEIGVGELASAVGRYYAMDRDKRWERLEVAWKMLTRGEGQLVDDLAAAVERGYTAGPDGKELTDEFVTPLVRKARADEAGLRPAESIAGGSGNPPRVPESADGKAAAVIKDGDGCFFFNFRSDRARQLTLALHAGDDAFPYFDRGHRPKLAGFATMTQYDSKVDVPVAFPPQSLSMILGEVLSKHGVSQLRTAETEKYAHVTYFFNGGVEQAFPGEERRLVPSNRDVATYDLAPEMSAAPVTDVVVDALKPGGPTFILVNYANPDMVGHTGKLDPAIHAVETVDKALGRIVEAAAAGGATVFITADHGNCETMIDPQTGQPHTAHTMNPIPFIAVGPRAAGRTLRQGGKLADVAPTVLEEMGIAAPPEMDGKSLYNHGK
jgi:2,3-bisphosphoglycerate-independent phosphoglycerate mutase